jgi:hypothetical protein
MVTHKQMQANLLPEQPDQILVQHQMKNFFLVRVCNASNFTTQQEIEWKSTNPNYSVTEPLGMYFLLTIEQLELEDTNPTDQFLYNICAHALTAAGDFWHDHITSSLN